MTTDEEIVAAIKKQKFRSANKSLPYLMKKFPDVDEDRLLEILRTHIVHDLSMRKINENTKYFNKVFSQSTRGWTIDLFVYQRGSSPPYFLIFINQNTRYAVVIPIQNRSGSSLLEAIKIFVDENKASTIVRDSEKAFISKLVIEFPISHGID